MGLRGIAIIKNIIIEGYRSVSAAAELEARRIRRDTRVSKIYYNIIIGETRKTR